MSVVIDGSSGITTNSGTVVSTTDATLNGLTVGKGGGSVSGNTVVGYLAMSSNTSGTHNTGFGYGTVNTNTTGTDNTGLGWAAVNSTTTGSNNTGVGSGALINNTTASNNTAVGYQAGYSGTTAQYNTFVGMQSGYGITTGARNTFVGNWNSGSVGSGSAVTTGSANTILGAYNGNQGGLDIRTASNYIVLSDGDGNPRLYCDGSGNWTAQTTVDTGVPFRAYNTGANFNGILVDIWGTRNTTNNSFQAIRYYNVNAGQVKFQVEDSGSVNNRTGTYGTLSDAKLKENIVDATPKLDDLNKLQVRNFNFKGDSDKQLGFIAQELEQVFPSLVSETHDKDQDGNDLGTVTKAVKTSILIPMLVKATQELKALVDAQATEIAELKAKVG